jgi:RNA polymerase sigma-70 factor (ECF subfamily)
MHSELNFDGLMDRLRAGENDAARLVFERYSRRLIALAQAHFGAMLARKADPEDVVQSAYKSFFIRHRDGGLDVEDWDALWRMLTIITLRKVADRAEYFQAARRDANREAAAGDDLAALDREPRPEEAALFAETVERLFRDATEDERPILELSLQGYSGPEISERLNRPERTIRRLRERVRKRLERMQAG